MKDTRCSGQELTAGRSNEKRNKDTGEQMELYKTVKCEAEAEQVIERSRFITHISPVETREEADEFISGIKKKYKDATHNVPAMVIGDKSQVQWASDDGEPQGTSGAPIVQMLVKEGITNVAVVVTRYFGGIKLGTGGLVRAYTSSAKLGLEAADICSVREIFSVNVKLDYTFLAKLQSMSADKLTDEGDEFRFTIKDVQYSDKVTLTIWALPEKKDELISLLSNITSGSAELLDENILTEKV